MNSSIHNLQFSAQHKNKCYCQNRNLCYCTRIESASKTSKTGSFHKFIKVRCQNKEKHRKSISSSGINSFSPTPTMTTSMSTSTLSTRASNKPILSPKSELTERRELYEKSQPTAVGAETGFNQNSWNIQERNIFFSFGGSSRNKSPELFDDDKIIKLQQFRLQNCNECLSNYNRYSLGKIKQSGKLKEQIEPRIKYTLNSRGLLKPFGANSDNGQAAIVSSKDAIKDVLRQKLNSSKEKDKFIRKALCQPENSLALRFQKTY